MSLLMDALKRAEETKKDAARAMTGGVRPQPGGLALEPTTQEIPVALPDLAEHIAAVDADLAAAAQPLPAPAATTSPAISKTASTTASAAAPTPAMADPGRAAVHNAFAAKLPPTSRRSLWLALGAAGLAAVGIAAYVVYQVSHLGNHSLTPPSGGGRPLAAPADPPPPAPVPATAVVLSVTPGPAAAEGQGAPAEPAPRPAAIAETPPPPAAESAAGSAPIKLVRTRPEADPNLGRAYQNLQGSAVEAARRDYELVLQNDPKNVDALLGLAAIAQRQRRPADAERFHQLALAADPRDAAAQAAALSGAGAAADPQAVESRLKNLLAAQPESGPLNFALGNLYARQGRWAEAQPVYFNAVAADADNPDYLFNLAVSLDHLRQPRPAAQHYRLALEAAERRPGAFDREGVKKRLRDLQP